MSPVLTLFSAAVGNRRFAQYLEAQNSNGGTPHQ